MGEAWGLETIDTEVFLSDSPGSHYENGIDESVFIETKIKSKTLMVSLNMAVAVERFYDYFEVHASVDGGKNYEKLGSITGYHDFKIHNFDLMNVSEENRLGEKQDKEIIIKLRITSDSAVTSEGILIRSIDIFE